MGLVITTNVPVDLAVARPSHVFVLGVGCILGIVSGLALLVAPGRATGFEVARAVLHGWPAPAPEVRAAVEPMAGALPGAAAPAPGAMNAVRLHDGSAAAAIMGIVVVLQIAPVLLFEMWWAQAGRRLRRNRGPVAVPAKSPSHVRPHLLTSMSMLNRRDPAWRFRKGPADQPHDDLIAA